MMKVLKTLHSKHKERKPHSHQKQHDEVTEMMLAIAENDMSKRDQKPEKALLPSGIGCSGTTATAANKNNDEDHQPDSPPQYLFLNRDMTVLANAFGLSLRTRVALAHYDARTLEDFALMTDGDYEGFLLRQAASGHPVPPLQQRKLIVLLRWVRNLAEEHAMENCGGGGGDDYPTTAVAAKEIVGKDVQEAQQNADVIVQVEAVPPIEKGSADVSDSDAADSPTPPAAPTERAAEEPSTVVVAHQEQHQNSSNKNFFVPSDWEERFYQDLPQLKRQLREEGEISWRSPFNDWCLGMRWFFCS